MNQFNYKLGECYEIVIENGRLVFTKKENVSDGGDNDERIQQTNEGRRTGQAREERERS